MKNGIAVLLIIMSGIASMFIAMAWVHYGGMELAALVYPVSLFTITIITIILFLIFAYFLPNNKFPLTIILVVINLLAGVFMRLDFYYRILPW